MKKECGCFDEQAFVVLQITFIRPSGTRHNFLRGALSTITCLSSTVVIKDNNCMRAHRIHSETRSIFDPRPLLSRAESKAWGLGSRMRRALESRYYEMQLFFDLEAMRARGIIVLVNPTSWSKISRQNNFFRPFLPPKSRRFELLVDYNI